ncbi:ABC transporter permease, partial [Klebsiella pneumoniae]|nr:ABC transporter permease [Klebsiella pneumoniae]
MMAGGFVTLSWSWYVSYLVSTRLIAGLVAIIPLYSLSVLAAFFAARFTTVFVNGQSAGLYDHYFNTFLIPSDLLWSFMQAIAMSIAVMLVHTYYGYNASGGSVGVGVAVYHDHYISTNPPAI